MAPEAELALVTFSLIRPLRIQPLNRRHLRLHFADAIKIELQSPIEVIDAILLLEHIGELRVAVAKHQLVLQQDTAQAFEPREKFFERLRTIAKIGRAHV